MINTDQIFIAASRLSSSTDRRAAVSARLFEIARCAPYQKWLSGTAQARPFKLPGGIDTNALNELGLVEADLLKVKLNIVDRSLMVTDGVWVGSDVRVFPFSDESAAVIAYCKGVGLFDWANTVVDLATGSGNNLAYFGSGVRGIGLDINPRALAYFDLNRALNGHKNRVLVLNDIRNGFADIIEHAGAGNLLILGNMPFGLAPTAEMLALTSNGGETGLELQKAAFQAIAEFMRTPMGANSRAALLGYSVGHAAANKWEIFSVAKSIVGEHGVSFSILNKEGLVRVDGRRIMANPTSLRASLHAAGSCQLYHADPAKSQAVYAELCDRLESQGYHDLAYLMIEIGAGK